MNSGAVAYALEAAASLLPALNPVERADAERLLLLCGEYWAESPPPEKSIPDRGTLTRELGRLVELLARRSATAMPLAALGRALLSELHGAISERDRLLSEFQTKLAQLGL